MGEGSFVVLRLCFLKQLIQGVCFLSAGYKYAMIVFWPFFEFSGKASKPLAQRGIPGSRCQAGHGDSISPRARPLVREIAVRLIAAVGFIASKSS